MRVLLDTHAFLWFASDRLNEFGKRSLAMFRDDSVQLLLSTTSIAEIAIKFINGTLDVTEQDVRRTIRETKVDILQQTEHHTLRMFELPQLHKDPFDRMLIATALSEDIPFMSRDKSVKHYRKVGLRIVW